MAKKFQDIRVGNQLELPRGSVRYAASGSHDPNTVYRVAIVTDIWFDPVDAKRYVGLAYVRRDDSYGKPTEKRTLTGLARTGWRKAQKDWISFCAAVHDPTNNIIPFDRRP